MTRKGLSKDFLSLIHTQYFLKILKLIKLFYFWRLCKINCGLFCGTFSFAYKCLSVWASLFSGLWLLVPLDSRQASSVLHFRCPLQADGNFFSNILGMSLPLCDIHVCHICCYFTSGSPFFNLSTLRPGYTPSPYPYLHSMIMNVKSMCICWQIVIYIILWYYYLWYIIVYIVYI